MRLRAVWAATTLVSLALLAVAYVKVRDQRAELDALAPRLRSLDFHCRFKMIQLGDIPHDVFLTDKPWMWPISKDVYLDYMRHEWRDVNACLPEQLWISNGMTLCDGDDVPCIAAAAAKVYMILGLAAHESWPDPP